MDKFQKLISKIPRNQIIFTGMWTIPFTFIGIVSTMRSWGWRSYGHRISSSRSICFAWLCRHHRYSCLPICNMGQTRLYALLRSAQRRPSQPTQDRRVTSCCTRQVSFSRPFRVYPRAFWTPVCTHPPFSGVLLCARLLLAGSRKKCNNDGQPSWKFLLATSKLFDHRD